MKSKILITALISAIIFPLTGCIFESEPPPPEEPKTPKVIEEETREPGIIHLDYPITTTTAEAGNYVLVPLIETIELAYHKGEHRAIFTFYKGKMVEPGEKESLIEDYFGDEISIPNCLIIPIKPNQSASAGDIMLTWWQSGNLSMMKGIVTEQSSSVRYLVDFLTEEEQLGNNSFNKLTGELEPGITVAKETLSGYEQLTVINIADDKVLTLADKGILKVENKSDLIIIPPSIEVEVGDVIKTPFISNYEEVTVLEVYPEIGQIIGGFQWADTKSSDTFFFGEIMK